MESALGKDLAIKLEEQVSSEVKSFNWPSKEEVSSNNLFSKLASFNNLVVMSIEGFEKEIFCLLRKMERRKGHGIYVSGGKGS